VLSGSLGVETEGRTTAKGAGDFVLLPPTRPHRLFNDSRAVERELLICAPARFDRLVAAAGTPVAPFAEPKPMTDEDRRRLVADAPKFGIRLLPSAAPPDWPHELGPSSPQILDVLGARIETFARFGDGDGDVVLIRASLPPGRSLPLLSHDDRKCLFGVNGELAFYGDGSGEGWRNLVPDEAVNVGPNVPHAIRNSGTAPADFLMVTTVRLARFFATIGSPPAGPAPRLPSPEELAALPAHAAAYGYGLATADENAAIGITFADRELMAWRPRPAPLGGEACCFDFSSGCC
jgi:quercetin dioxygenase-like cupin family protein